MSTGDLISVFNGAIGAFGVLVIFVALLLTGTLLVTRRELDEMRRERDEWRTFAETQQKISEAIMDQLAPAAKDVLSALQKVALGSGKPKP